LGAIETIKVKPISIGDFAKELNNDIVTNDGDYFIWSHEYWNKDITIDCYDEAEVVSIEDFYDSIYQTYETDLTLKQAIEIVSYHPNLIFYLDDDTDKIIYCSLSFGTLPFIEDIYGYNVVYPYWRLERY